MYIYSISTYHIQYYIAVIPMIAYIVVEGSGTGFVIYRRGALRGKS